MSPQQETGRFEPTRESLKQYSVPQWFQDAKLGIFIAVYGNEHLVGQSLPEVMQSGVKREDLT